jgi:hypothetical protein
LALLACFGNFEFSGTFSHGICLSFFLFFLSIICNISFEFLASNCSFFTYEGIVDGTSDGSVVSVRRFLQKPSEPGFLKNTFENRNFGNKSLEEKKTTKQTKSLLEDVVLTPDDVANVLRTLDNDKAHGPDGIPVRLLTETASQIAPSLCDCLTNRCVSA